jgi:hypothetical protein
MVEHAKHKSGSLGEPVKPDWREESKPHPVGAPITPKPAEPGQPALHMPVIRPLGIPPTEKGVIP